MTALDLDAIQARADAATVGPWVMTAQGGIESASYRGPGEDFTSVASTRTQNNWEFIAHAREDVPALVAEVRLLRGRIVRAKSRLHAGSIPLGMSEAQFNSATILDTLAILARPLSSHSPTDRSTE